MCCEFQTSAKLETKPGSLYKNGNHGNSFVTGACAESCEHFYCRVLQLFACKPEVLGSIPSVGNYFSLGMLISNSKHNFFIQRNFGSD